MIRGVIILTFAIFVIGCQPNKAAVSDQSVPTPSAQSTKVDEDYVPDNFGTGFGEDVVLVEKKVFAHLNYIGKIKEQRIPDPHGKRTVQYAVLEKNGKTIASFGKGNDMLSEIRFSAIALLKREAGQLVIEQTSQKNWRYWIIRLSPKLEVIFDSGNYDAVFRLRTIDADNDGNLEIIQNLGTFWYVPYDNLHSPRPEIIFQYSAQKRRFLPANHKFQSLVLSDVENRLSILRKNKAGVVGNAAQWQFGAGFFDVMLRYLYAGKKKEGWEIFERESFPPMDKEELRKQINEHLKKDAIYKEIYKNQ